jgi:hypothetical protein
MRRHVAILAGFHQGAEELGGILFPFQAVSGLLVAATLHTWSGVSSLRGVGKGGLGRREFFGQAAPEGLKAFFAAGIKAHGSL